MSQATRRGFLKHSSLGAIAASVLGALPSVAFAQAQTPTPEAPALDLPAGTPSAGAGLPAFTVFVSAAPSTDAVIYIGEREIPITNRSVIEYLKQVAATG